MVFPNAAAKIQTERGCGFNGSKCAAGTKAPSRDQCCQIIFRRKYQNEIIKPNDHNI
jgi:hypothetical protein